MENEKKNSKGLIIIISLLVVIIIGLALYICYDKVVLKNEPKEVEKKGENSKEESIEKELNDIYVKNDILEKIYILNVNGPMLNEKILDNYMEFAYPGFFSELYSSPLSDDERLNIAINASGKSFEKTSISYENMGEEAKEKYKTYASSPYFTDVVKYQVSSSIVEKKYKELFGKKLVKHKDVGRCPYYVYDSKNNVYFYSSQCGGTSASKNELYVNKITTLDDELYAYVNLAYITPHGDYTGEINNDVYDGIDNKGKLIENVNTAYKLSENYSKFSNYKFIFKKDTTGNYYFYSIEH